MEDWNQLMMQTPTHVPDLASFDTALHLYPTVKAVKEYNHNKLKESDQLIATIKAVHILTKFLVDVQ